MQFNSNNNFENKISVNTTIYNSYGIDSLLTIGCWNEKVSIRIANSTGQDANGRTQYNRESPLITALYVDNVSLLTLLIEDKILPALKEEKEASVTIKIGDNTGSEKLLTVYTKDGEVKLIVKQIGSTEGLEYTHTFPNRSYYEDLVMNPDAPEKKIPAAFLAVYERLKEFKLANGIVPHGMRYTEAIRKRLHENNANRNNNFNSYNNAQSYSAPVTTYDGQDANGFLPFE